VVVVDQYPPHVSEPSLAAAKSPNIRFILALKAGAALYETLDRKLYGNLKTRTRAMFDKMAAEENRLPMKESTVQFTDACCNQTALGNILDAWDIEDVRTELNRPGSLADDEFPTQGDSLGDDHPF
jgi:hypothetical protein